MLPKHLDEEVAVLHLYKIGSKLTKLTPSQAEYISVLVENHYKLPYYGPAGLCTNWVGHIWQASAHARAQA